MPAKTKETQSVSPETAPTENKQTEQKYTIGMLRKYCVDLFGITSSTFDGAFYGQEGEFTKTEAETVIKTWLGRKE